MPKALLLLLTACTTLQAVQLDLEPRTVVEAVALGQSAFDNDKVLFHRPYHFDVARAPLDVVDVVTPYRRVVIQSELRARTGDRRYGQREAQALVDKYPGQVSVHAEFTFHPLNTFVLVPAYRVVWVTSRGVRIEPATFDAAPRYFVRTGSDSLPVPPEFSGRATPPGQTGRSQPLLGATVVAFFNGATLERKDDPVRAVVIEEASQGELARLPIDLARLR
ncbi:MAG TPA: hypothetical protein VIY56_01250 [Vicinamibacterales bacterium]